MESFDAEDRERKDILMTTTTVQGNLDTMASTCSINERESSSAKPRRRSRLCNSVFLILCLMMALCYVGCVSVDDAPAENEDVCARVEVKEECASSKGETVCARTESNVCAITDHDIAQSCFQRDARALNAALMKLVGHRLGEVPVKDYLEKHAKTKKVAQAVRTRTVEVPEFDGGGFVARNVLLEVDDDFGCVRTIEAFIGGGAKDVSADLMEPFERAIGRASKADFLQDGGCKRSFWLNDPDSGGHYYLYMTSSSEGTRLYATCSFNVITKL